MGVEERNTNLEGIALEDDESESQDEEDLSSYSIYILINRILFYRYSAYWNFLYTL